MKNEKAEYGWEVLPWGLDDTDESYAIYVDRNENRHPDLPVLDPDITISNQADCAETFGFGSVESLDRFVARLMEARKWLLDGNMSGEQTTERWPGQKAVEEAERAGRIQKCAMCDGQIVGSALACVRPGCPMKVIIIWNEQ